MTVPYDLTCWYLNDRRIIELIGAGAPDVRGVRSQSGDAHLDRLWRLQALKDGVIDWMRTAKPSPLGVLLTTGTADVGKVFTHLGLFGFRGLSRYDGARRTGRSAPVPVAYSKLDSWIPDGKVTSDLYPEHLTSASAWGELSGQKRKFFLGVIQDTASYGIRAIPYLFADIVENQYRGQIVDSGVWSRYLEVHIDQIDSFARVSEVPPGRRRDALDRLRAVPERQIKEAIAEILGEPNVPKDWGGESSDLFSSRVTIDGKRISTAFLLKGPASFRPMTMAQLGSNGDQIQRLFTDPAELLVLQHCHEVTAPVRVMMRAFAQQMGNARRFAIIDGYDTIRLLVAYGKCGFGAQASLRPGD
jgi:hypothetical protein